MSYSVKYFYVRVILFLVLMLECDRCCPLLLNDYPLLEEFFSFIGTLRQW